MKHNFEERKQRRIDNARARAAKNRSKADQKFQTARHIGRITQGEPIKVGHHSEGRHRRDLDQMDNAMRTGIDLEKKADYQQNRAASIEANTAIFSDDPNALPKLKAKLTFLETLRCTSKEINKAARKGDRDGLVKLLPEATIQEIDDLVKAKKLPWYTLPYIGKEMKRIQERIELLEKMAARQTVEETVKGVRYIENTEANRVQLIFPQKPNQEVRQRLRKVYNFNWSPTEGAWQRHLNGNGIYAAKQFLAGYTEE